MMLSRSFFLLLAIAFLHPLATAKGRQEREIAMAENAIFWSLVASAGSAGRLECARSQFACSDDRAELGLALIAEQRSPLALTALINLLRYRIDGGLAESYSCYVLSKKSVIVTRLSKLRPKTARTQCESEVTQAMQQNPNLLRGVSADEICRSERDILSKQQELLSYLSKGKQCDPVDF